MALGWRLLDFSRKNSLALLLPIWRVKGSLDLAYPRALSYVGGNLKDRRVLGGFTQITSEVGVGY